MFPIFHLFVESFCLFTIITIWSFSAFVSPPKRRVPSVPHTLRTVVVSACCDTETTDRGAFIFCVVGRPSTAGGFEGAMKRFISVARGFLQRCLFHLFEGDSVPRVRGHPLVGYNLQCYLWTLFSTLSPHYPRWDAAAVEGRIRNGSFRTPRHFTLSTSLSCDHGP